MYTKFKTIVALDEHAHLINLDAIVEVVEITQNDYVVVLNTTDGQSQTIHFTKSSSPQNIAFLTALGW